MDSVSDWKEKTLKIQSLPYNFSRITGTEAEWSSVNIGNRHNWIVSCRLPYNYKSTNFIEKILAENPSSLFDGCDAQFAAYLKYKGFETIRIGKEAILDTELEHFRKKSIKELVRRGLKKSQFTEVIFAEKNKEKLKTFISECTHGSEPQLKYLFNDKFQKHNRLFALVDKNSDWLGAMLISDKDNGYSKTDLILRRKEAPVGIMEALIYSIFNTLKNEGCKYLSLGAVPFIIHESSLFTKERLINLTGRKLKFAYNYEGLHNFKNKFNPLWKDYFFCVRPKLTFDNLIKVLVKTNLLSLVLFKLKKKILFRL